jgi:general secretion pathway protein A
LLESICEEFHITLPPDKAIFPTAKAYFDSLNSHLLDRHAAGESCVLIIDEAQNLAPEVLEQLRLLTNLETDQRKLLQIVLIGQPELRDMLARPDLEQLAQRVTARCHLDALNLAETRQYIAHRLTVAGLIGNLPFDGPALKRIHELTRGVPRRINLLCGRALLGVWAKGEQQADRAMIDRAAKEVFGLDGKRKADVKQRRTKITIAVLALLLASALGALAVWSSQPKAQPTLPASPPAQ